MELFRIALRALFAFALLHGLIRASGKHTIREGTAFDFVLALLLGELVDALLWAEVPASQFAMAVATLFLAHTLTSLLAFHSTAAHRVITGEPALLVQAGLPQPASMRREHVSDWELAALLREHGVDRAQWREVREARLENAGELSVLREQVARDAQRPDVR